MQVLQTSFSFEEGEVLLVDKPVGWTSFDVVNHLRLLIKRYLHIPKLKIGHAGTLDPLASGLLIICTGKLTKQIQALQDQDKVYVGKMRLGMTTPSYDLETEPDAFFSTTHLTPEHIEEVRKMFIGEQQQLPPVYSAVKIDGKRAFHYARKQKEVQLKARIVTISNLEIDSTALPELSFRVECSKGTYIRSLVHDIGQKLQSGATLTELRRVKSGNYDVLDAWDLSVLKQVIQGLPTQRK